jgi:hypothetical protein
MCTLSVKGQVVEDRDISGIAMASATQGMIAADEGVHVQFFELDREKLKMRVTGTLALLNSKTEIDIEAIAYEAGQYFAIGSHGLGRVKGEYQPSRLTVFRIDLRSGRFRVQRGHVGEALQKNPVLSRYFLLPLQRNGLNVEGLAVRDGQLFIGFRGPHVDGKALVLQANADGVFDGAPLQTRLFHVDLGEGYGIRDIMAHGQDFLLIAGNAGVEPNERFPTSEYYEKSRPYWIVRWNAATGQTTRLAKLDEPPGKAEALMLLEETPNALKVVVLFDGPKEGKPTCYRVPKKPGRVSPLTGLPR